MDKLSTTAAVTASVLAGAIVWFVLDVILGVAVWISFVAGGAILVLGVMLAVGAHTARTSAGRRRGEPGDLLSAR